MSYSQNNEEQIIREYFGSAFDAEGTLLDIGANDGMTLSNSYPLIAFHGWKGVLVEPSEKAFEKLVHLYDGNSKAECHNVAINDKCGEVTFYSSGAHIGRDDSDLLSTIDPKEMEKWKGKCTFTKTTVKAVTIEYLLNSSEFNKFDLITIDAEGVDYEILTQLDLTALMCKMLIVESNSIDNQKYIDYAAKFGMKLIHKNYMNLIFTI